MKPAFVLLFVLFTTSFSFAQRERGLTEVVREECLSFPRVTPADQMKEEVHYTRELYCSDEDSQGNCDNWESYLKVKYNYLRKRTLEYWTADGRLVTSKKESTKRELSVIADVPSKAEPKFVIEIEKLIFKSSEPVCEDSFYK